MKNKETDQNVKRSCQSFNIFGEYYSENNYDSLMN